MKSILYILLITLVVGCKNQDAKGKPEFAGDNNFNYNYRALTPAEKTSLSEAVRRIYDSILGKRGFNGGIIVTKNGEVLLEDYKGYANPLTKDTITPETPFHVASVSKTFTGMAVLKLWEENKLNIDDSLQ
ncbi:MAG TPA: serine hydrolase domain-containing protein, partial [Segetibacter sp.]